mmetsp:Transcript_19770/g.54453  ORF Transcript_19770/g.54453 Transcript_19770/m.54453 type:complete len:210 (+) Transcript_19770:463-1092(+)
MEERLLDVHWREHLYCDRFRYPDISVRPHVARERHPGDQDNPRRFHFSRSPCRQHARHQDHRLVHVRRCGVELWQGRPPRAHCVLLVQLHLKIRPALPRERSEAARAPQLCVRGRRGGRFRRAAWRRALLVRRGEHHIPCEDDAPFVLRCQHRGRDAGMVEPYRFWKIDDVQRAIQPPAFLDRVPHLHRPWCRWRLHRRALRTLQHPCV